MSKSWTLPVSRTLLMGLAIVVGGLVLVRGCGRGGNHPVLNTPAPDATTRTLAGESWRLRDQRGKVVLIDFWATWCPPCRAAVPHLQEIYAHYRDREDFLMVGVSLDRDSQALNAFLDSKKIAWLQLFEPGGDNALAQAFGIRAIPSVWVIDREGRIQGADLRDPEEIRQLLDTALAAPPPTVPPPTVPPAAP